MFCSNIPWYSSFFVGARRQFFPGVFFLSSSDRVFLTFISEYDGGELLLSLLSRAFLPNEAVL